MISTNKHHNGYISEEHQVLARKGTEVFTSDTRMKGSVVAAYSFGTTVEIWVSSPTGDSSDSFTYQIPCKTEEQAKVIAEMWSDTWKLGETSV